jgi:hypothetical protein
MDAREIAIFTMTDLIVPVHRNSDCEASMVDEASVARHRLEAMEACALPRSETVASAGTWAPRLPADHTRHCGLATAPLAVAMPIACFSSLGCRRLIHRTTG